LLFIVSGASFKIKEQGFLRKSHQKHTPWIRNPGSGKNSSRIPDPGGKKAKDPGSGSATLNQRIKNLVTVPLL
jgi:hypothetical protein